MGLAAVNSALRITGGKLTQQRLLFAGAGEAALGTATMVKAAMVAQGLSPQQARERCWLLDTQGLLVADRAGLPAHKLPHAQQHEPVPGLQQAIKALRADDADRRLGRGPAVQPASAGRAGTPLRASGGVRALEPTAKAECSAQQAYEWTGGRAIFCRRQPVAPVEFEGRQLVPGQANNALHLSRRGTGPARERREAGQRCHVLCRRRRAGRPGVRRRSPTAASSPARTGCARSRKRSPWRSRRSPGTTAWPLCPGLPTPGWRSWPRCTGPAIPPAPAEVRGCPASARPLEAGHYPGQRAVDVELEQGETGTRASSSPNSSCALRMRWRLPRRGRSRAAP